MAVNPLNSKNPFSEENMTKKIAERNDKLAAEDEKRASVEPGHYEELFMSPETAGGLLGPSPFGPSPSAIATLGDGENKESNNTGEPDSDPFARDNFASDRDPSNSGRS